MVFKASANRLKMPAFLLLCFFITLHARAQNYVTIPDTGFVKWLNANGYQTCLNGNQLDTTCNLVLSQTYLNVSYTKIADLTGIQYFKNLDSLRCNVDSVLSYIPSIPPLITVFECRNNLLDSLPALPAPLIRLSCESNNLSKLPVLPGNLQFLACYNNQLTTLPALPAQLQQLYCSGNQLDSLPAALPTQLTTLWCYGNRLSALPALPAGLTTLLCSQNNLHSLPALGAALRQLDCYSNTLTSLPNLPDSLNALECQHNQLTSLPALPPALTTLNCEYNKLTSLLNLPDSMFQLYIDNNPNLACLPVFNTIWDLEFFNDPLLTCAPTYGNVYNSLPALNSLPVCDSSNTTACTIISGIEKNKPAGLNIYPNPAADEVFVTVTENAAGYSLDLFDLSGRQILHTNPETLTTAINTSPLAQGMYLLRLSGPHNQAISYKLAVQH
jgi:Secretion system C-terminal sorting domain